MSFRYTIKKDFHDYQHSMVNDILSSPKNGILGDMGLGKTIAMLTAIKKVKKKD